MHLFQLSVSIIYHLLAMHIVSLILYEDIRSSPSGV